MPMLMKQEVLMLTTDTNPLLNCSMPKYFNADDMGIMGEAMYVWRRRLTWML